MKKILSCLLAFFVGIVGCDNMTSAAENSSGWELQQQTIGNNSGVECISKINVSEPICDGIDDSGLLSYRKKVEANVIYRLIKTNKIINEYSLHFYFEYNNNEVKLSEKGLMKNEIYAEDKIWKISSIEEVHNPPKQCVVSQRVGIYSRENGLQLTNLEQVDSSHLDIICTPDGTVTYNIEAVDDSVLYTTKTLETTANREQIKKDLIRISSTTVEKYDDDNFKDNSYKYLTVKNHITYENNNGKILGDSIIKSNFRFNPATQEVVCLSMDNEHKEGNIDVNIRTGNILRSSSGAYGELTLKYPVGAIQKTFKESLVVKCDNKGEISCQFVN